MTIRRVNKPVYNSLKFTKADKDVFFAHNLLSTNRFIIDINLHPQMILPLYMQDRFHKRVPFVYQARRKRYDEQEEDHRIIKALAYARESFDKVRELFNKKYPKDIPLDKVEMTNLRYKGDIDDRTLIILSDGTTINEDLGGIAEVFDMINCPKEVKDNYDFFSKSTPLLLITKVGREFAGILMPMRKWDSSKTAEKEKFAKAINNL